MTILACKDRTRFERRVIEDPETGCHIWQGFCEPQMGYGMFWLDGRMKYTHRVAWEFTHGPVPAGQIVRHRCDNPPCVNLVHLELGTQQDNMDDAVVRGRTSRGADHPEAKLSEADVIEMRRRRAAGEQVKTIAHAFGVNPGYASRLIRGLKWRHVA